MAYPTIVSCFQELGCYEFCEKVQKMQSHPQLTKLFALNLHNHQIILVGVKFELTTNAISMATRIPCMGERYMVFVILLLK